ncbi:MAG: preprotein translocase subunit YajC [Bacteroidetes bacterium]|nr:preprotein translocase subunit YajC [Bacteroidota bacterium]MBU2585117.1 preprotein translocase subunit YajC [Bacteroidota bacterium]
MFAAIFLIFYFLIIRPQQKRQKERTKLLNELKKGDKVVTGSGIYGIIVGLDEKTALIQVSDNVKLKFERSAVATILSD